MTEENESNEETKTEVIEPDKIVTDTNAAATRLEKATAEMKATIEMQKALQVEATREGTAQAAVQQKKETNEDYAEKAISGGMNDESN